MRFTSNSAEPVRVARTDGHVILIGGRNEDGSPKYTEVADKFVRDAVAEGAIPEGVPAALMSGSTDTSTSDALDSRIETALVNMALEKLEGEFTSNGLPVISVVGKRVGAKVSREQVYAVWNRLNPPDDCE